MRYERTSLVTALALLVVASTVGFAGKGGSTQDPATAMFTDVGNKIRSDSGGGYVAGEKCVISWVDSSSGQFFFRTTGGNCYNGTGEYREIVLDFSDAIVRNVSGCSVDDAFGQGDDNPVATPDFPDKLDICGVNTVPDVRWLAGNLFGSSALSAGTPLTLRINLEPDFRYTAFELQFEQSVPVTGGSTTRTMSAGSSLVAELYQYTGQGNKKVSLGRFHMPFELEVMR